MLTPHRDAWIALRRTTIAVALLVIGIAQGTAPGTVRAGEDWDPCLMIRIPRVGGVQVSPDGTRAAYTVRRAVLDGDKSEYVSQIYLTDCATLAGRQLTQGDKSSDEPQWSPDGQWLAFLSSRSGRRGVWLIRPDGGEAVPLTDHAADVSAFRWSPDGRSLAFISPQPLTAQQEARQRRRDDARIAGEEFTNVLLYVVPVADPPQPQRDAKVLTPRDRSVQTDAGRAGRVSFDWSPDGKSIVFSHTATASPDDFGTADISLVHLDDGSIEELVATAAAESNPLYSPDGRFVAYAASDVPPSWAGSRRVRVISLDDSSIHELEDTQDGYGRYSELIGWSADGTRIYFSEAQGATLRIMELPLQGSPVAISTADGMSLSGVTMNARRTHFGWSWETFDQMNEACVSPVRNFAPVAVSRLTAEFDLPELGKSELIRWKSTDGLEIEGILTLPVGYRAGDRCPLLVIVHGGPMGVFTRTFDGTAGPYPVAAFASRGFAMLRANVRGSSGYGRKFRYANYGDWGGGDYRDLISGVEHLIKNGIADPERMGIMGWSYGGYMTAWTITQTARFRAASVGAGVTNLTSFTGTADIPGFLPDYFGDEHWNRGEPYRERSPMQHVRGVATPTLIQHGERDRRVPLSQGEEFHNALKRQGCPTLMVIYPRSPHSIEEPRLLLDCMRRNLDWFATHLSKP
jgi:dipeptidyl aminopeptidase/acylaminoacyl peptidase